MSVETQTCPAAQLVLPRARGRVKTEKRWYDRGVRHGYGQYTNVVKGEVYTGEWFQDKRGGSSILDRRAARGAGTHLWDDKSRYRVRACLSLHWIGVRGAGTKHAHIRV